MTLRSTTRGPREPLEAEDPEIQGRVPPMDDQLRDRPPDRRGVLDAVAAESGREQEVRQLRVRPDDRVLVERGVLVVARPGVALADRVEVGTRSARAGQIRSSNRAWSTVSGSPSRSSSGSGETAVMKASPSGRNQIPDVSMTSGQSGTAVWASKPKTHRRRASTGSGTPAIAATSRDHGPAASTT